MNTSDPNRWHNLEPRPRSFYRQMFVKGTRIRAEVLYDLTIHAEEPLTPEQVAADYNLPVEAVREAIAYCENNADVLEGDFRREEALFEATGRNEPGSKVNLTPKVLSPQERARIRRS